MVGADIGHMMSYDTKKVECWKFDGLMQQQFYLIAKEPIPRRWINMG